MPIQSNMAICASGDVLHKLRAELYNNKTKMPLKVVAGQDIDYIIKEATWFAISWSHFDIRECFRVDQFDTSAERGAFMKKVRSGEIDIMDDQQ